MWDRPLLSVSDNLERPGKSLVFPAALFSWWIWDAVTDSYENAAGNGRVLPGFSRLSETESNGLSHTGSLRYNNAFFYI